MRRPFGLVACVVAVLMTVPGCGGSGSDDSSSAATDSKSASCSGSPAEVMVIATLTGTGAHQTDMPAVAKAAAKALNGECQLGGPMEIEVCDAKTTPNAAAACARQAVADKALAVIDNGLLGDSVTPILEAGHVVDISALQVSAAQMSSPWVFAFGPALMGQLGQANALASAGAEKIDIITYNIPAVVESWKLTVPLIQSLGSPAPSFTLMPPTAVDMSTYVAQALSKGATGIIAAVGGGQLEGILKSLSQQGVSLKKIKVTAGSGSLNDTFQAFMKKDPASVDGLLMSSYGWPSSDASNSGIAKMKAELEAVDEASVGVTDLGAATWTAVHTIGNVMEGASSVDSAALKAKLDTATVDEPQLVPLDFSKPAFEGDKVLGGELGSRRIPSSSFALGQICGGKIVPITRGFVSVVEKTDLSKLPC